MRAMKMLLAASAVALTMGFAASASAMTFVNVASSSGSGTDQISWVGTATGGGTLTITNLLTHINFDDSVYNDGSGEDVYLNFTGTSAAGAGNLTSSGGNFTQGGLNGSFTFKSLNGSVTYLAGTFSDYWLQGTLGQMGSGNVTSGPGTANFTSGVVDLTYVTGDSAQFGFTLAHPAFTIKKGTLQNFKGNSVSGSFSGVAVPEPATWGLMIMGFGGAGAMLRSRRRQAAAA